MNVRDTLWVEKYRPESLDEIIGQDAIVRRLTSFVGDDEMPHLLFGGPQGVGKTAMFQAYAKEQYGDSWRQNVLELNASDERGIDVVRDRIKNYARQGGATTSNVSFKLIFLDEADQLTKDAQPALRRTMEDFSDSTRFVLSCNYVNKIIQPIQSRCAMFRVGRLDDEAIEEILHHVADEEGVSGDPFIFDKIVRDARGDARKAINTLQAATIDGELDEESVKTVVGVVNDTLTREIIDLAISGDLDDAMRRLDVEILKEGVNPQTLCDSILRVLKRSDMPDDAKVKCVDKLGETEWRIMNGANPNVQFHSLLSHIHVARHLSLEAYNA